MDGKSRSFTARLALAAGVMTAFAGSVSAGRAEPLAELPVALAPSSTADNLFQFVASAAASGEDLTSDVAEAASSEPAVVIEHLGTGIASYYGRQFAGRPTASGERFDPQAHTAAHRTLPFGSRVRVTNPRNGQSVVVRINDRGPFHGNRTIDLSRSAAEDIGIVAAGVGSVEIELLRS